MLRVKNEPNEGDNYVDLEMQLQDEDTANLDDDDDDFDDDDDEYFDDSDARDATSTAQVQGKQPGGQFGWSAGQKTKGRVRGSGSNQLFASIAPLAAFGW